jgi:ferredoxin, 2Fe-2S
MPKVTFTAHDGEVTTVVGKIGDSVMQTAVRNGVRGIVGECGGVLSCATCHVFADPDDVDRLPPVGELEDEMLDGAADERQENSRLSCQITLTIELGDISVTMPEHQE